MSYKVVQQQDNSNDDTVLVTMTTMINKMMSVAAEPGPRFTIWTITLLPTTGWTKFLVIMKTSWWSTDAAKDNRNFLPSMQWLLKDGVVAQWLLEDGVVRSIIVSGSENHRRSGPSLYSLDASYPITELHIIMRCHDGQLCRMQDSDSFLLSGNAASGCCN